MRDVWVYPDSKEQILRCVGPAALTHPDKPAVPRDRLRGPRDLQDSDSAGIREHHSYRRMAMRTAANLASAEIARRKVKLAG